MRSVFLILIVALLSGCEVIQDALFDCIDADGPEFNMDVLPSAVLNQEYSVTIIASIDNEPNDSRYEYTISLQGDLPNGLRIVDDNDDRTLIIGGTPTEQGNFPITLSVHVKEPKDFINFDYETGEYDDGNNLCFTTHHQDYVLIVTVT